jgi:hypothetical protein
MENMNKKFNKTIEILKKNQMEILEMKSSIKSNKIYRQSPQQQTPPSGRISLTKEDIEREKHRKMGI